MGAWEGLGEYDPAALRRVGSYCDSRVNVWGGRCICTIHNNIYGVRGGRVGCGGVVA